jgi:hypothetical protein
LFGKAAPVSANGGMSSAHRRGVAVGGAARGTRSRAVRGQLGKLEIAVVNIAGSLITPVLVFWTLRVLHWVKFTFETGFELPSSWIALPDYGSNRKRNILVFMRWPQIDPGAQDLNDIQRPKSFQTIAGSKVRDEYYNSYLRK